MKLDLKTRFDHKYGWWLNERTCRGPVEFSFLPPRFLLPWDTYDSRESASPLQWGTRGGARGTRDPPPPLLFLSQTVDRRTEKKFFETGLPLYLRVWMTASPPPPLLSEGLSEQIPTAFSIPLPWPKHSISSVGKCSFCLCYTYNASLSLFCWTETDLSSSLSRFVCYVRSVFNLVAKILGPVEQARFGRMLRLLELQSRAFNF